MNNFRRSIPDNTNRHALILTHSSSRFILPRCALHSDNPGLWDIQLSSRDFCESNAKVMSLINRLFLGFRASHGLREDYFGSRLPVTTLSWPTAISAGFRCDKHHLRALCTLIAVSSDFNWQTDSDFHYRWVVSHMRKPETGHTTHIAWQLWRWAPPSTSGIRLLHGPAFQRFTLLPEAVS